MRSSEKQLVGVADSASAEATKDIHCVQFAVNQSWMMRILLCCARVDEVTIIHANVEYLPPYKWNILLLHSKLIVDPEAAFILCEEFSNMACGSRPQKLHDDAIYPLAQISM